MTYDVDTTLIRQHANLVGGVGTNFLAMSNAGSPDPESYGEILKALGLPSLIDDAVGSTWDSINQSATGTFQVENGLNHMASRYDADDDLARFLLIATIPVASPAGGNGGGSGGGPSISATYAASPADRSLVSGAGILDSGTSTFTAICEGNWIDAALSGVSLVLDAAATAADPIGSLLAAGIGWAIDHLDPIKGWFDDVTGNPEAVVAKGQSWGNIATGLEPLATAWNDSLTSLINPMTGDAVTSYKGQALTRIEAIRQLKGASESAQDAMALTAALVSFVHGFLRDVLASLIGAIISWVAETLLSLGTLIPWVIGQIATRIASVVGKCSRYISSLTRSSQSLSALLRSLKTFGTAVLKLLNKITPNPSMHTPRHAAPGTPGAPPPPGGWKPPEGWTPPRGEHAKGPLDNLQDIPGDVAGGTRDAATNNGLEGVKKGREADSPAN